jgi:dihydrofolate synthase/folylpolyglutamate synthase
MRANGSRAQKDLNQDKNIRAVALASALLNENFEIPGSAIKKGIKDVIKLTGLRGRWDILSRNPLIVADIAHNEAGIKEVFNQAKSTPHKKLHVVFGTVNDKDISKILTPLPKKATYYFCKADIPRALDASLLASEGKKHSLRGEVYDSVKTAVKAAKKQASSGDLILITGSAFVVAEAI